jgi:hypothetical protein
VLEALSRQMILQLRRSDGMPFTNKHKSTVFVESASNDGWRVTVGRFAS